MDNFEAAQQIWRSFVPKSGQANTVQGELLRAVEKLRDEALRNGNLNWDEGFETLLEYLREKLNDSNVFSEDLIHETMHILQRLGDFDNPYLEDDIYDTLGDRIVEYYRYYGSMPRELNPHLYR